MKLILASGNKKKLGELRQLLVNTNWEVLSQLDFGVQDADESGLSFVENAIIKARHACAKTGLPALADDSGIEVDALNGAPGIHSARFSGRHGDDGANNALLLERLAGVPSAQRTARYRAVLVFMRHAQDPSPRICEGTWEGRLLEAPRGEGGFGYDPYFLIPALGKTAAELAPEEKNRLSHRGQALAALLAQINTLRC